MALEITVGPPQLAINEGNVVLVTEPDGQIVNSGDKGLYFFDTRLINSWQISANGVPWNLLNSGSITHYATHIFLVNGRIPTEKGEIPRHSIGLSIGRSLGGGMHEDLDLTNYGPQPVRFNLEIAVRCDFADIFEVKAKRIVRRVKISSHWSASKAQLGTVYTNRDFSRDITISIHRSSAAAVYANGRLSFEVEMDPGSSWHACLLYRLTDGGRNHFEAPRECIEQCRESVVGRRVLEWKDTVLKNFAPVMRRFTGITREPWRTWPRYACRSRVLITWRTCPLGACPGSWRCSGATA